MRTEIRHANIERPLEYCRETDSWDDDSKFRFMIETSEPITSFLGRHTVADAEEVRAPRARRSHSDRRTAQHGQHGTTGPRADGAAVLSVQSPRPRSVGVPASRTAQIDDVIGLTWPLATFCAEADIPYFFHGPNGCGHCLQPAQSEPVFHWQGPDQHGQVLMRSAFYGGYAGDSPGDVSETHMLNCIQKLGANWPYDALLLQEGTDFQLVTLDTAKRIRTWNAAWAYPHIDLCHDGYVLRCLGETGRPAQIKTFAKDSNNQWADQDANDAWLLGRARRTGETDSDGREVLDDRHGNVAGGGYPWTDIYQAYHRLLAYHEHTNAIDFIAPNRERMRQYETELEENREMVAEAQEFAGNALTGALDKLVAAIPRSTDRTVVVLNPLTRPRTDVVHLDAHAVRGRRSVDRRRHAAGSAVAEYAGRIDRLRRRRRSVAGISDLCDRGRQCTARRSSPAVPSLTPTLENRYYRVTFDAATGTITSIFDKDLQVELVDQAAPHRFNEYLYERFESSDWNVAQSWHRVGTAQLTASSRTGRRCDDGYGCRRRSGETAADGHPLPRSQTHRLRAGSGQVTVRPSRYDAPERSVGQGIGVPRPAVCRPRAHRSVTSCPAAWRSRSRDLFDGACTAYYAVRHFSDVSNRHFGVTVSAPDSSLIEYDHPRSCPIRSGGEGLFERDQDAAGHQPHVSVPDEQHVRRECALGSARPGPVPLLDAQPRGRLAGRPGRRVRVGHHESPAGNSRGRKTAGTASCCFAQFRDHRLPQCGLHDHQARRGQRRGVHSAVGRDAGARDDGHVTLPFLPPIAAATETNLIEDDRPQPLAVGHGQPPRHFLAARSASRRSA